MAKLWIVIGDPTSGGGQVISGSAHSDIDGKPIARIGDQATCPLHLGVYPIVSGDFSTIIDEQPVARHGDQLACGCTLLSAQQARTSVE